MKNIWKLLMIALMALAMVGCPQDTNKDDDDDAEEVTPGTFTADLSADLYAGTAAKNKIGATYNTWGGFSVLLMKDDQEIDGTNPQALGTLTAPVYQLKMGGNMSFPKYPSAEGNAQAKTDANVYASCAAVLTSDDFTFIVDPAKITLDQVYVMANSSEIAADAWIAAGRNIDLKGYKPYIIALFDATEDVGTFAYEGHCDWGAEVYKMAVAGSGVTFPTTWDEFLPEPKFSLDTKFAKQAGAAFVIMGGSAKDYEYPIVIPFNSTTYKAEKVLAFTDLTGWGGTTFKFWFKLRAGDDSSMVMLEKQYGSGATTLGTPIKIDDADDTEITDLTAAGNYKITVDFSGDDATILVATTTESPSSDPVAVSSVTLDQTTASVAVGDTVTLTATVLPANATDKTVTWTTSDAEKATVENGVVTGVAAGENITITATAGDKSATCTVTVTE